MSVSSAYANFIARSLAWHQQQQVSMTTWLDPQAVSPCQLAAVDSDRVLWQPVRQTPPANFSNVEHALELALHPSIKDFYSEWFGANLAAKHPKGPLALLMPWHQADVARLQENMIGHILMKRRLKQQETIFFAVTDDDNIMLSILNHDGAVYQESVGKEVTVKVADSLAAFLEALSPMAYSPLFD